MNKIIRTLSLLLCLIMVLSCFAACGEDTEDPTEPSASADATEPELIDVELGAVYKNTYTIVEIDRKNNTALALKLEDENSYKDETYTEGCEFDIDTQEVLRFIAYTRDSKNRLTKVTYTDKDGKTVGSEEYTYTAAGQLLSSSTRDADGITVNSVAYTYNEDGTYSIATSEEGRLISIVSYDANENVTARNDYEYAEDGSYKLRSYASGKLTQEIGYAADGTEATRAVYTYNADGSFKVTMYENGVLKTEESGNAEEAQTQPEEPTTQEKEVLDTDTPVNIPTSAPATEEATTKKNNKPDKDDTTTSTRPVTTTEPEPITDASGNVDMLAQSRLFRSGKFYITGYMGDDGMTNKMVLAVTDRTMYASLELDVGEMMGMGSTGTAELGFLSAADGTYYLLESTTKTYCPMDEATMNMLGAESADELFGEMNFTELLLPIDENAQPDKTETKSISGQIATCYTFNTPSGEYAKHYVNNDGELIRVEDYSASGGIVNYLEIDHLSGEVADYMMNPPTDYTKTDLLNFMIKLMGDNLDM